MRVRAAVRLMVYGSLMLPFEAFPAGRVTLLFYDRNGAALSAGEARALSNNSPLGYDNDALVDPSTLGALAMGPLYATGGTLAFDLPAAPAALAFNWPTEPLGYSLVVLDNGGAGFTATATVNFTYQAALDAARRLDAALAARPAYQPSASFAAAYDSAAWHLAAAAGSSGQAVKGKEGQLALDQLAVANDALLSEYGVAFARARVAEGPPWLGVTIDTTEQYRARLDLAASLCAPWGWVRVVFDRGAAPADYADVVSYAKAKGLKILGQPVDSSEEALYSRSAYRQRFVDFIAAFPEIDAWEVGNEVNGSWLSAGIAEKVGDAAAEVRARAPGKLTVLTLFWQLNTDDAEHSVFTWARAHLPAGTRQKIDAVLLSQYVEQAPMGLAFDEVMEALRSEFPSQRIGIGELGYWCDGQGFWWAFDRSDPGGAGRRAAAAHYYRAALGYEGSAGGGFWWYFAEEFPGDDGLQAAVRGLRDALRAEPSFPIRISMQPAGAAVPSGHYAECGSPFGAHDGAQGTWSYGWR